MEPVAEAAPYGSANRFLTTPPVRLPGATRGVLVRRDELCRRIANAGLKLSATPGSGRHLADYADWSDGKAKARQFRPTGFCKAERAGI